MIRFNVSNKWQISRRAFIHTWFFFSFFFLFFFSLFLSLCEQSAEYIHQDICQSRVPFCCCCCCQFRYCVHVYRRLMVKEGGNVCTKNVSVSGIFARAALLWVFVSVGSVKILCTFHNYLFANILNCFHVPWHGTMYTLTCELHN